VGEVAIRGAGVRIVHWGIDAGALFQLYLTLFLPVEDIG